MKIFAYFKTSLRIVLELLKIAIYEHGYLGALLT